MRYSKRRIKKAGETLVSLPQIADEYIEAARIVNYWRGLHQEPLQLLFADLKKCTEELDDVLVAGRIKKLDTIIDKLKRPHTPSDLRTMYDIAGCRVIARVMWQVDLDSQSQFLRESPL